MVVTRGLGEREMEEVSVKGYKSLGGKRKISW